MKKFYTTILAALCVFGASAVDFKAQTVNPGAFSKMTLKSVNKQQAATMPKVETLSPMAVNAESFVGDYDWNYTDAFEATAQVGSCSVSQGEESGQLVFRFITHNGQGFTVNGTYARFGARVTIEKQQVGKFGENEGAFFMGVVASGEAIVEGDPIYCTYDEESGTVTIVGNIAVCNEAFTKIAVLAVNSTLTASSSTEFDGYTEIGEGEFKDGIFGPMYGVKEVENTPQTVRVFQKDGEPNHFKIATPWAHFGLTSNLEVDATDPEYVHIPVTDMKFEDEESGQTMIVSMSWSFGNMVAEENTMDKAAFLASQYAANNITYNTETRVVTFPNNACFFFWPKSAKPNSLYTTNVPYAGYLNVPSAAAIGNIATDVDTNAPVEYFNLQGIKIANPEAGQVVIRRQGSKVSKLFVK